MQKIDINDILEDIFNKNSKKYKIRKYDNKIEIYNTEISILIYFLKYILDYNSKINIENIINNIEIDIGLYGSCQNEDDVIFWTNLKKCIIVFPEELEKNLDNREIQFITYIKEKEININ